MTQLSPQPTPQPTPQPAGQATSHQSHHLATPLPGFAKGIQTIPGLLPELLAGSAASAALSWREAGYWRHWSTEQFAMEVRRFALGLVRLGLHPGDAVGILAPSSPHWLAADLAIQSVGGVSVPMFPNLSPEHLAHEVENADVRILVVVGEDQWRLAAPLAERFRAVVVKNVASPSRTAIPWKQLLELGDEVSGHDPTLFARRRTHVAENDVATIIHTSGSTGNPKGVVLTHRNLVSQLRGARECFPLDPAKDIAFSCLPLAHVFERLVVYVYLSQGVPVRFADDVRTVGALLKEVRPTVMTMVPRLIEKLYARIAKGIEGAPLPRRLLGQWALKHALNDDPTESHGMAGNLADVAVYKRIRAALGGRLTRLIVGGAALAPELARFLTNIGVPVYNGYGLTEASPVIATNCPIANRIGTVGKPFPGVEVRIAENGEILARGANVMRGYHRQPEATTVTIDRDGWLHTGDLGRLDSDGYLIITGRMKELLKTSNGKYVCPVPIEQGLKSRLIDLAMVIAEGRRFVAALLFPDFDNLRQFKQEHGLSALTDAQALASAPVKAEIDAVVAETNQHLDRWEQIKAWRLVPVAPQIEAELTPTMKLRRHVIEVKWKALIDEMYQETDLTVETTP